MTPPLAMLAARFDAFAPRRRATLFLVAAALISAAATVGVLQPMARRQAAVQQQLRLQYQQVAAIEADITQRVLVYAQDPDAAAQARLAAVRQDSVRLAARLRSVRSSLVAPENMAPLLAALLKVNGRLTLESLATLAPPLLPGMPAVAGVAAVAAAKPATALFYRHGVRLCVSGSYADMVAYMEALEAMPTQLFWGEARLDASAWPQARLTLTMYTLSLDATWISL